MARLWMAGDEYNDTLDGQASGASGLWDLNTGTVTVSATYKRSGEYGSRVAPVVAGSHYRTKQFAATSGTDPKFALAIQPKVRPNTLTPIVRLYGTTSCSIRAATDGSFELWDATAKIGSSSAVQALDTWFWLNLSYVASTGVSEAKINGTSFASGGSSAGSYVNTVAVGIGLGITDATGEFWYDDYILNNQSDTNETGDPEDQKVIMVRPNADGSSAQGSRGGTDSGSDWGQLDEVPPNDADYYILDVDNDRIELNCGAASVYMGANDRVIAVQPCVRHRPETAAAMSYAASIKSGGSREDGQNRAHNDITVKVNGDAIPRLPSLTSYVDPATAVAWTTAGLDAAEVGVLAADATPDIWITALSMLIAYVPVAVTTRVRDLIQGPGIVPYLR